MFTGIVTDIGTILENREGNGGRWLKIGCRFDPETIEVGASIACSGVCLTVTDKGEDDGGRWFCVDASRETVDHTTLKDWPVGGRINLERALRLGDELGGHIVTGHIDGVAELVGREADGASVRLTFRVPGELARFIAPKGSVALDGTSLTVNEVEGDTFGVNVIPHTLEVTTWGKAEPGDMVNIEIDMMARYVARLNDARTA
ncbi:riboflavin synthase [Kaustia mangrovi]|uniref:Riboflavin synthase n=1 Tax=Kaustia mangrovi TaxID=2593653 RepID=A0A7S8HE17_9HYPH|nr:riboflavin synthase [Kaustia mangrovi]QPC44908.1 riboflavin synthase [Kaustia mangrovi]